jgi:hypothetical protein
VQIRTSRMAESWPSRYLCRRRGTLATLRIPQPVARQESHEHLRLLGSLLGLALWSVVASSADCRGQTLVTQKALPVEAALAAGHGVH